ncbi:MAG: sugar phosphate isomerase/epimerase family protein [Oscillospiraceae bacterium]
MFTPKMSVILSNVGNCSDRYLTTGYSEGFTLGELFDRVASIDGVEGVELIGNSHIRKDNIEEIRGHLDRTGLKLVSIIPDHFAQMIWGKGAFCSKDEAIRKKAIKHTKDMMDAAAALNCKTVSLWPGQDGYDYYFQGDFINDRMNFMNAVRECCAYNTSINVSIEYKPKEPRIRSYPSNISNVLLMVREIGMENCGVTIDYGHALAAYENVAESVALAKMHGDKLFHLHMNDNFTLWDDDMIVGSVHTIGYLEFFYWLKKTDYKGFISTDQYPYREDGCEAVRESVLWMKQFINTVNRMDDSEIEKILSSGDAVLASKFVRRVLTDGLSQ